MQKLLSIHHHYTCTIGSNRGWAAGRTDVVQHRNLKLYWGSMSDAGYRMLGAGAWG